MSEAFKCDICEEFKDGEPLYNILIEDVNYYHEFEVDVCKDCNPLISKVKNFILNYK